MFLKVYLCAFKNQHYLEEAKLCITSLRSKGCFTGPIYLFTDMDCDIREAHVIKVECDSVYLSSSFKTRIFEYLGYDDGDIFLYLDTDIIVFKPLPTFETISNKIQVYGYEGRTQEAESFCGFIVSDTDYITKPAINTGILLFRPSAEVKYVFDAAYDLYCKLIKEDKVNLCWEQPALCYEMIKNDMMEISLTDLVYENRTGKNILDTMVFNHFCGLRGIHRQSIMIEFLNK